jgi:hypothetical protein
MKRQRGAIRDKGDYLVDERNAGEFRDDTTHIVMDCVWDRDKHKQRIKIVRTSNPGLYCGASTVAIFKIIPHERVLQEM